MKTIEGYTQDRNGIFFKNILGKPMLTPLVVKGDKLYTYVTPNFYLVVKTRLTYGHTGIPIYQVNNKSVSATREYKKLKNSLTHKQKSEIYGKLYVFGADRRIKK